MVEKVEIRKEYLDEEIEKLKTKLIKASRVETYGTWLIGKYAFELTTRAGNQAEIDYIHQKLSQILGLSVNDIKVRKNFYSLFPNLPKLMNQYTNIPLRFYFEMAKRGCDQDIVTSFIRKNESIIKDSKITTRELLKAAREEGLITGKNVPKIYCEVCGFELPEEQKKNTKIIEELYEKGWRINTGVLPLEYDKVDCEWRYHAICDNCWNTVVLEKVQLLEKINKLLETREVLKKKMENLRKFMFSHGLMVVFDDEGEK